MEYFPLILKSRIKLFCKKDVDKIDDMVHELKNYTCEPHLFCHGDYLDDECLYEFCRNPKLRDIGKWIMKRIVLDSGIEMRTVGVRLRIANGMLNKISMKTASEDLKIHLQHNFVNNVQSIFRQKFAYELPFQRPGLGQEKSSLGSNMEYQRITQSEIETIKEAQKGNKLAFNKLFYKYKEFVDKVLFNYVNDMDEAKDLTNVVFLKVHQKLSTFTDYSSFGGWLRIIANRTAIDYLRKMREKSMELGEDTGRLPAELTNSSEEEDLVNLLEYESLLKEFKKLPKKTQTIFNLFYVEDLTVNEISKVLKTPTGTIKAALSRTRRKIKNNLNV